MWEYDTHNVNRSSRRGGEAWTRSERLSAQAQHGGGRNGLRTRALRARRGPWAVFRGLQKVLT
jgi:hypothetical protein